MTSSLPIPADVLKTLVCIRCRNFLSVFPIYTKDDGTGAVCGRCKIAEDDKFVRDEAYESIAQFFPFPCRFGESGCKDNLVPAQLEYHELYCEFRRFDCPSKNYSNCTWKGLRTDIVEHFSSEHTNLLLKEPSFEINFVYSLEECLLLSHGNEIFNVKKEVDARKGVFSCSIEHMNVTEKSDTFNYFLRIVSSNKNFFFTCPQKNTSSEQRLNSTQLTIETVKQKLQDPDSVIVNIEIVKAEESTTEIEEIPIEENAAARQNPNIIWALLANMECPVCLDFMLPPIYQCANGHSYCEKCKIKIENKCALCRVAIHETRNFTLEKMIELLIYPCKYHKAGCTYSCISTEIRDHEICCEFGPFICPLKDTANCDWEGSHSKLFDHIDNNHNEFILKSDQISIPFNDQTMKTYIIKYEKKIFQFHYNYGKQKLYLCVQIIGRSTDAKKYRFEADVIDLSGLKRKCFNVGLVSALTSLDERFQDDKCVKIYLEQINGFYSDVINLRIRIIKG
ncbi:uncharacterized protein [Diabrotica undecimpunctata]|uniref:uncharacterized protein n=1 Tax=Diabrotica undecimpunctata TaxID=50387 RepID=UPI003B636811